MDWDQQTDMTLAEVAHHNRICNCSYCMIPYSSYVVRHIENMYALSLTCVLAGHALQMLKAFTYWNSNHFQV